MTDLHDVETEIQAACLRCLDSYFVNRDPSSTLSMFSPDTCGFGTGLDEVAYDRDALRARYARDVEQAPNPAAYEIIRSKVLALSPESGLVSAEMNIRTVSAGQEIRLNNLRLSMVFRREGNAWAACHMHISLPTTEHEGDESCPVKGLEGRARALERLVDEKTAMLKEAMEEIRRLSTTDTLTGLYNRARIDELLAGELNRCERYNKVFSVILLDVDHFKQINDRHGHLAGDAFLKDLASLLSGCVRNTDSVGRWGGEEFLVICPETDGSSAMNLGEKIREALEEHDFGLPEPHTASMGVTSFSLGDTPEILIARADSALYEARENGRNHICCHLAE